MNRDEIKEKIRQNLASRHLVVEEIRVQPDIYSGWRIVIVSPGFERLGNDERKSAVLAGLNELKIQWIELLTPGERDWAGGLPADIEPEGLPLWPESLARGHSNINDAVFPSDLDEDLPPPIVSTFYSLRGGVGRSTALAYTAYLLADRKKKVVCVDLDLEAPGLAALFGKESEVESEQGVVKLLIDLEQGAKPDVSKHLIRVSESHDLYCLPAGIPDADYARRLALLDPEAWYREERNPLRDLLDLLATGLPFTPDVILLDSRTGITRLSAPLLFDLADLAFIIFFPHPQTRIGTSGLVRALLASHTRRSVEGKRLAPEPRFVVSPIPSSKVPEIVQRYRHRAAEWIHDWLSPPGVPSDKWVETDITHFIPYQDVLATSDQVFNDREVWRTYEPLAEWIQRFLPTQKEAQTPTVVPTALDTKRQILNELSFPTGTAEHQVHLLETFVETDVVSSALKPDIPLVLGRKGAGKTALFRWLKERPSARSIVVLAPAKLRDGMEWLMTVDGFRTVEENLLPRKTAWHEFWSAYICIACHLQWGDERAELVPEQFRGIVDAPKTVREVIELIERLLGMTNGRLLVGEWLTNLDNAAEAGRFLLFDGLDTGFGSAKDERQRRTNAIEGLFTLLTDRGDALHNLRFKIVLREDIWRQLRFDNKSHLFGRLVRLAWENKAEYLTIVLRQALRSPAFVKLVDPADAQRLSEGPVRDGEAVDRVWNMLVGERMKGGNTTYTTNWVWNRLADAKGNRGPRALLQLFEHAAKRERQEQKPYDKSIIRPRALIESLDSVSTEALSALLDEEFIELSSLREKLEELKRTPVSARELENLENEVALAREIGLLSVYEGTESDPTRYKIPDIYRIGLGMTRMGQV